VIADQKEKSFFGHLWPKLEVISCWRHGPSELYAQNLRQYFPTTEIQGKGLVATEAFVSLPFQEGADPALAVTSHFFEFQEPATGRILLAHEVQIGAVYRVIVTTGGGLYRYPLGDLVEVTGFVHQAPCLKFIGREGNTSDLFGEKLHGFFVEKLILQSLSNHQIKPTFFLLAPHVFGTKTAYVLFLDALMIPHPEALMSEIESGLMQNFHYAHCRRLGQLGPAGLFQISRKTSSPEAVFQQVMVSRGVKLGDVKMVPLDSHTEWAHLFSGRLISELEKLTAPLNPCPNK
jgi:hypothetical protein